MLIKFRETLKQPLILVFRSKLADEQKIVPVVDLVKEIKKPLVVFCQESSEEVVSLFKFNRENSKCFVVNIPDYFDTQHSQELLDDIALSTGASIVDSDTEIIEEEHYGGCELLTLTELETIIVKPKGDLNEISTRLKALKSQLNSPDLNQSEVELMRKRISALENKSAIILIGGSSEVEKLNLRDKIVDCINACRGALENGILPGGGNSFIHCYGIYKEKHLSSRDLNGVISKLDVF